MPVLPIGSHHQLVLLRSHPHEGEIVARIDLLEHGASLLHELIDQSRVLCGRVRVHGGLDRDTFGIHDDRSNHALMRD